MSDFDVYDHEMADRVLSEQDVEILLSGSVPEQESLARLSASLRSLHDTAATTPSPVTVSAFAAEAARIATAARADTAAAAPADRPRSGGFLTLRRKLAGALAAVIVLSGMTGVAVASDGAAPGDPLYGLDRAMEAVGVGAGGPTERITEAQALFNEGLVGEAIAHAAEAVETTENDSTEAFSPESSKAAEALKGAAARVANDVDPDEAQDMNSVVAGVLEEIASMLESDDLGSADFGDRVSDLARSIGPSRGEGDGDVTPNEDSETPGSENPGPPADAPGGPPEDVPSGPPANVPAGPPADTSGGGPSRP